MVSAAADGVQRIDIDENMTIELRSIFTSVSLCRDRFSRPDTLSRSSFTRSQLDAVAPLSRSDILSLRADNPAAGTKEKMRRRIEAACNLKYRGNDRTASNVE